MQCTSGTSGRQYNCLAVQTTLPACFKDSEQVTGSSPALPNPAKPVTSTQPPLLTFCSWRPIAARSNAAPIDGCAPFAKVRQGGSIIQATIPPPPPQGLREEPRGIGHGGAATTGSNPTYPISSKLSNAAMMCAHLLQLEVRCGTQQCSAQ